MSKKDEYVEQLHLKLDEFNARIDRLKMKADAMEAEKRQEYYQRIERLKSERDRLKQQVDELKNAAEKAWGDLKIGVEHAKEALGRAIDAAGARFE